MKRTLILTATALTMALAAPVLAGSDGNNNGYYGSGNVQWMSPEKARAKATQMGYDVRRVKRKGGYYEIYAFDKTGQQVELYLHPTTGKLVKAERKF